MIKKECLKTVYPQFSTGTRAGRKKNYFLKRSAAPIMAAVRAACLLASMFCEAVSADCWKMGFMSVMMSIAAIITTMSMYKGDQSLPRFNSIHQKQWGWS